MPTYVYRRADGTRFEHQQRITEDALSTCPTTGQAVTRVPSASAGLVFKGSGFYQTDYVRPSGGADKDTGAAEAAAPPASDTAAASSVPATPTSAAPSSGSDE